MSLWSLNTKKIKTTKLIFSILLLPAPVVSLRTIASSMYLIFIRTNRKYILPTITSLRWYLQECKKGENNSLYTFVSQFYIQYGILKRQEFCCIKWAKKRYTLHPQLPVENQRLFCWTRIWLTCNKCDWTRQMEFLNIYTGFWFI